MRCVQLRTATRFIKYNVARALHENEEQLACAGLGFRRGGTRRIDVETAGIYPSLGFMVLAALRPYTPNPNPKTQAPDAKP